MKKLILILCLIIAGILIAGSIDKIIKPPLTGDLIVELGMHDFFLQSLILQKDRTLIFIVSGHNTSNISLSPEEADSLKQVILDNNFFSLKERYEGSGCCDFIAHTIMVAIGDKNQTVYCYNDCPKEFNNIKEKIKSLWPEKIQYHGLA